MGPAGEVMLEWFGWISCSRLKKPMIVTFRSLDWFVTMSKPLSNCVSKSIIFELAAMMRLPGHILVGWAGAGSSLIRHFQIRDNFSQGTHSCTGFAEGDGLSCVAMQLLDCLLHWWMDVLQAPLSDSYVCGWLAIFTAVPQPCHPGTLSSWGVLCQGRCPAWPQKDICLEPFQRGSAAVPHSRVATWPFRKELRRTPPTDPSTYQCHLQTRARAFLSFGNRLGTSVLWLW